MKVKEVDKFSLDLLNSFPNNTEMCGIVRSVSASGMSRVLSFVAVGTNEPQIMNLTYSIAEVLGYKVINHHGFNAFRINGAGMDMIFKVVYDLGIVLHDDGYYFTSRQL